MIPSTKGTLSLPQLELHHLCRLWQTWHQMCQSQTPDRAFHLLLHLLLLHSDFSGYQGTLTLMLLFVFLPYCYITHSLWKWFQSMMNTGGIKLNEKQFVIAMLMKKGHIPRFFLWIDGKDTKTVLPGWISELAQTMLNSCYMFFCHSPGIIRCWGTKHGGNWQSHST